MAKFSCWGATLWMAGRLGWRALMPHVLVACWACPDQARAAAGQSSCWQSSRRAEPRLAGEGVQRAGHAHERHLAEAQVGLPATSICDCRVITCQPAMWPADITKKPGLPPRRRSLAEHLRVSALRPASATHRLARNDGSGLQFQIGPLPQVHWCQNAVQPAGTQLEGVQHCSVS